MPVITVNTNVAEKSIPVFFQAALTNMMTKALQKPKEVMFVDLRSGANIMMGGDRNPCVFATVECIGRLNPTSNLAMARDMEDMFIEHLNVRRERIVIRFIPVPALFCSFNGALHDVSIERDEDIISQAIAEYLHHHAHH
uniref:Macrophage migration inhibitory factor n=1 Tax=Oncomelania hupensis TaxID=56141 RepID=UPI0015D65F8F|nr:Chain B, Macrophage migration inhibitory factor [Oncomelania hupensis]